MKQSKLNQIGIAAVQIHEQSGDPGVLDELTIGEWFHLELMHSADHRGNALYCLIMTGEYYDVIVDGTGGVKVIRK